MILVNTPGTWSYGYAPLRHAEWHGLTPTDLIFPFFLFIVGISIYFAYKNKPNNKIIYKKIIIRSLKIIGLGLFLGLFLPYIPFVNDFETLRFPGVLQRIGVVFLVSAILYINCNWKTLLGISITILVGYWLFLGFVTFPDGTLPAIVSCISGILIGRILDGLQNNIKLLFVVAFILLISGYIVNIWFPINKAIWSSSFVLAISGWGTLILAIIYYFTDVRKIKFGSIFKYVGMNAITIYFLSSFISKTFYLTKISETDNIHSYGYDIN